jgi:hypothetical protein
MTKYAITNIKDAERHLIDCEHTADARQWIVNHLDLSKGWNIKEDNFVAKNKLDVSYRNIQNIDNQWSVMSYILDCLSDKQLGIAQKLINKSLKDEKNQN